MILPLECRGIRTYFCFKHTYIGVEYSVRKTNVNQHLLNAVNFVHKSSQVEHIACVQRKKFLITFTLHIHGHMLSQLRHSLVSVFSFDTDVATLPEFWGICILKRSA